jgi:N-acetylneuraminate synthase
LLAATAIGAEILEFHVTFDKKSFGPDSTSSIEISKIGELIKSINYIKKCVDSKIDKKKIKINKRIKNIFSKSLAVNKNLYKNQKINIKDLETKKPGGYGIDSRDYKKVINKKINKNLDKNNFLNFKDII